MARKASALPPRFGVGSTGAGILLFGQLIQHLELLFCVRRPIVQVDDPRGGVPVPVVAVYVADEDRTDVFSENGGGHWAAFSASMSLECWATTERRSRTSSRSSANSSFPAKSFNRW